MRVSLPSDWSGVTLRQFSDIYDLIQDKSLEPIHRMRRIVAVLADKPFSEVDKYSLATIKKIYEAIDLNLDMGPAVESFTHKGYIWKVNKDITKLTAGEYISLTHFTKEGQNIVANSPQILAILCKPHRKKWFKLRPVEIEFKETAAILSDVGVNVAYPLAVFFCNLLTNYILIIEASLSDQLNQTREKIGEELNHLKNTGAGS
jgi:hypothetical protein